MSGKIPVVDLSKIGLDQESPRDEDFLGISILGCYD